MSPAARYSALSALLVVGCAQIVGADFDVAPRAAAGGSATVGGAPSAGGGGSTSDVGGGGLGGDAGGTGAVGGQGGTVCTVDGGACQNGSECCTGICVDDVCCDRPCGDTCSACVAAATGVADGTCAYVSDGLDPSDECNGALVCDGTGDCCGGAVPPTGVGIPAICDTVSNGECHIDITNDNEFELSTVTCPPGFNCLVSCFAQDACRDATVACPPGGERCTVECTCSSALVNCCERTAIACGDGPCSLQCVNDEACNSTVLNCGMNSCQVDCMGSDTVTQNCGSACSCVQNDC